MHHRRSGHSIVVGIMDEAVLRVIAFESFSLVDVDALHGSPISYVVLQFMKLTVNSPLISQPVPFLCTQWWWESRYRGMAMGRLNNRLKVPAILVPGAGGAIMRWILGNLQVNSQT